METKYAEKRKKAMKLYVVRHGQSENNLKKLFTGWTDAALTEKGIQDALGVREFLGRVKFDKVYASDLQRAKKTAETALPGYAYETTPLLREIHLGKLENHPIEQCAEIFGEAFNEHRKTQNYVPYGGEDREMLDERAKKFLDMMAETEYSKVAAFAHGGMLKALCRNILGKTANTAGIRCPNCSILILDYDGNRWRMDSWLSPDTVL